MSTIDSYSLVAGANISYDIYRPLLKPDASDRELVMMTKIGIVISWALGFALAFMFDRLMALWVFMATFLTSTVLVPIFMGLFWPGNKTPAAGVLSCVVGLLSVIGYYLIIGTMGVENEIYGTYIWTFSIAGSTFSLWQEYALYFSLPSSLLAYTMGNFIGEPHEVKAK
jgi:SSS family solute:Na+ symporter